VAEGNLTYRLAKSFSVSFCNVACLLKGNKIAERIAVEVWGLPAPGLRSSDSRQNEVGP
jgi:hypothetical protein